MPLSVSFQEKGYAWEWIDTEVGQMHWHYSTILIVGNVVLTPWPVSSEFVIKVTPLQSECIRGMWVYTCITDFLVIIIYVVYVVANM